MSKQIVDVATGTPESFWALDGRGTGRGDWGPAFILSLRLPRRSQPREPVTEDARMTAASLCKRQGSWRPKNRPSATVSFRLLMLTKRAVDAPLPNEASRA
jgi:hypothetical protein